MKSRAQRDYTVLERLSDYSNLKYKRMARIYDQNRQGCTMIGGHCFTNQFQSW